MSGFCGIINFEGVPVDPALLRNMAEAVAYRGPDGICYHVAGNVGFAHLALHTTPQSFREHQPLVNRRGNLVLVADARVDNRLELISTLTAKGSIQEKDPTDADLIMAAYEYWGKACPSQIIGSFVFAVWDVSKRQLLLVRDQLGSRPCYYYLSPKAIAFASEIQQIRCLPGVSNRLNENAIAAQIAGMATLPTDTFFCDVAQLAPAHSLLTKDSTVVLQRYWCLEPERSIRYHNDDEYAEHFLSLFRQTTAACLRGTSPAGVLLSGGLDSSTVTCVAADHLCNSGNGSLRAYTWDFTGDEALLAADEQAYAQAVTDHWELPLTRIPACEHWPLSDIDYHPIHKDSPLTPHYQDLLRASMLAAKRDGVQVMLSGFPGDPQNGGPIFPYLDYLLTGRWLTLLKGLRSHARRWQHTMAGVAWRQMFAPLRKVVVEKIRRGTPNSKDLHLPGWMTPALQDLAYHNDVKHAYSLAASTRFQSHAQRLRYNQLVELLLPQIAVAMDQLAAPLGMEWRHPWLDVRLFEFPLAIPQEQLFKAGEIKYVVRNAMKGLMPEKVRQRQRKAYPIPLFNWALQEKEVNRIKALLEDPLVAQFGFIDAAQLAKHYQRYRLESNLMDPAFWYALTLEHWLRYSYP